MQVINLYRYTRLDGGVTITPDKPKNYDGVLYRLIADEGKELIKDNIRTACVDTESTDGWLEVDAIPIEDGNLYQSIYDGDNVWTPEQYPAAWELQE